jgi:LysM repeat protein
MQRLTPKPPRRRSVSERVRRLITYVWILAAMALPIGGVVLISEGAQLLAPGDPFTYQVNAGDTLYSIALRYGVSVDSILGANGLTNPDVIYVGQQLVIPVPDASGQQVHTVQAGESLSMIARRYTVTVDEIVSANGLADRNRISVGQRLVIPGGQVPQAAALTAVTYTVQRGDSLYRIALIFGITVDDLLAVNDLAGTNAIYPGLELRIPTAGQPVPAAGPGEASAGEPQTGGLTYTVRLGDTLYGIAIAQGVTVDGIVAANALTRSDQIYVGQVLNLPEAGQTARPAPAQTAVSHRVVQGQTLYEIALRYGVTVSALSAANGINNPAQIVAGQVLSIPSAQAGSSSVAYASQGDGLCVNVELQGTGTGYFIRPVRGYVITQQFFPWHSGIDLALDTGNSVFAADSGTVIFAGWNPVGYGNLIVLDHGNGWRTYYAHLSQITVSCGAWIPRGSIVGASGSTGNSTGPHLHFEMLRYGIAVNPGGYIRFP